MTAAEKSQVLSALQLAMEAIKDGVRVAHPLGAPSGIMYAALMQHGMELDVFQAILDHMTQMGTIQVHNHLVFKAIR